MIKSIYLYLIIKFINKIIVFKVIFEVLLLLVGITIFCDQGRKSRPVKSHGFTACHTVSLLFSGSHGRFFVSHGFTNCEWILFQTHSKKTNKDNIISCQKNIL